MTNIRTAATGGAPLGPDVLRFFRAIGVPLRQVYGQTEMVGVYCAHRADDVDYDTVGRPLRGVEIRIDNPDRIGSGRGRRPPSRHVRRLLAQRGGRGWS